MRITEIASAAGWEKLDPNTIPSVLWDKIPSYYRQSTDIWALNPSKSTTSLIAIGSMGSWVKVINSERYNKDFVGATLTKLANFTGRTRFWPRSGWIWQNQEVVSFFDAFSFPKIAQADDSKFWYEIPIDQEILGSDYKWYHNIADHLYAILSNKSFSSADALLVAISSSYKVFTKGKEVVRVPSNVPSASFQNLVSALKLEDTRSPHGSTWVILNGKVEDIYKVAFSEPDGALSDGTQLWKVPSYVLLALSTIQFEKTWKTADSAYLALLPGAHPQELNNTILVAIRKGNILGMARGNLSRATEPELDKLAALLASEKGVGAGKEKFIKPESNFHKMLRYVNDNPGGPRSGWYSKGLGLSLQGMPPIDSPKALDGLASRLGLLTLKDPDDKPTQYHIRLTRAGELALSRLDADRALPMSMLLARLKK